MEDKPTDLINILSPYKVTRRDDSSLLLEEDTSMLRGILLFCLASIIYGFIALDTSSAIILACVVIFFLTIFRIVAAFDRPVSVDLKKGTIILEYLRIFGGEKVVTYDLSMIKGLYPEAYPTKYVGHIASVRLLLMNDKSIKIFHGARGEEASAKASSELVAKMFSELLGTQIISL